MVHISMRQFKQSLSFNVYFTFNLRYLENYCIYGITLYNSFALLYDTKTIGKGENSKFTIFRNLLYLQQIFFMQNLMRIVQNLNLPKNKVFLKNKSKINAQMRRLHFHLTTYGKNLAKLFFLYIYIQKLMNERRGAGVHLWRSITKPNNST